MKARGARQGPLQFAAITILTGASMVAVVEAFGWYETYQSESFGDRRLETPRPEECEIVRTVIQEFAEHRRAGLLSEIGTAHEKVELRAFAWASNGPRAGRGADWRKCSGLGRFVRGREFERFASGEMGPTLYVSREQVREPDGRPSVWVTFFPPQSLRPGVNGVSRSARTWKVKVNAREIGAARVTASWSQDDPPL
jgi:hypothetical protein